MINSIPWDLEVRINLESLSLGQVTITMMRVWLEAQDLLSILWEKKTTSLTRMKTQDQEASIFKMVSLISEHPPLLFQVLLEILPREKISNQVQALTMVLQTADSRTSLITLPMVREWAQWAEIRGSTLALLHTGPLMRTSARMESR